MRNYAIGLVLAMMAPGVAMAGPVGFAERAVEAPPHHGKAVGAGVWYSGGAGGVTTPLGENPVFVGMPTQVGAEVAPGRYPVVLMSHGLGGHFLSLRWLASG